MRKILFSSLLLFFILIGPQNYTPAQSQSSDPGNNCYPWVGDLWFCNWWGYSQEFSRGPFWWSTSDWEEDLEVTISGYTWHFTVTIFYTYTWGTWQPVTDCVGGTPAHFNNNGDWRRDYNDDSWFDNCDTCDTYRLKWLYYCFPVSGAVSVSNAPGYGAQPAGGATMMLNWLNSTSNMFTPFNNPAANPTPGADVVYSKRYTPTNCN